MSEEKKAVTSVKMVEGTEVVGGTVSGGEGVSLPVSGVWKERF